MSARLALHLRAVEQQHATPLLQDPDAQTWAARLPLRPTRRPVIHAADPASLTASRVAVCIRARVFDDWCRLALADRPDTHIIELGCGLSTRRRRLDLPPDRWLGVDRTDLGPLLSELDPAARFHAADLAQPLALRKLIAQSGERAPEPGPAPPRPTLLIAEGLLMYLDPASQRRLIRQLATLWPGAVLCFDAYRRPAPRLTAFHDAAKHLAPHERLRSTRPRSTHLRYLQTLCLADLPEARARLPRLHRLPLLRQLFTLNRARLTPPS